MCVRVCVCVCVCVYLESQHTLVQFLLLEFLILDLTDAVNVLISLFPMHPRPLPTRQ